ncbi:hypothetical protein XACLE3_7000001 [Xanthomonas citri pv. citri]|nr:hypothetical protein XACLE3_7000001 [Xanthomonas citri pv. citri]
MSAHGLRTARDGLRWHLIEQRPGRYDWSSFLPMLHAANSAGTQVIWDLCHYGWPDDVDIWTPQFVDRFARFAAAAAQCVKDASDAVPFYAPLNEISFWAWNGGDHARMHPLARGRGFELKHQLVRATIAAIDAIRQVDPRALPASGPSDPCGAVQRPARPASRSRTPAAGAVRSLGHDLRQAVARTRRCAGVSGHHRPQLLLR